MPAPKGTIVITGANGGLGTAIVSQVTSRPDLSVYYGLYLVRDTDVGPGLQLALAAGERPSHPHEIVSIDLTNFDSIRNTAKKINKRISDGDIPPIQGLILNAGYQNLSEQTRGIEGLDPTFTVNYLGHWLLVLLLLKSMDKSSGRIVVIGSQVHDPYSKLNTMIKPNPFPEGNLIRDEADIEAIARGNWSSASEDPSWRSGYRRYGAAKLCAMMMVHELQDRMGRDASLGKICVLAVDPGYMSTGLQRYAPWLVRVLISILFPIGAWLIPGGPIRYPDTSARHVLRAAFESDDGMLELPKGLYFDGDKLESTSDESRDAHKREMVWKASVTLTNLNGGETVLSEWH